MNIAKVILLITATFCDTRICASKEAAVNPLHEKYENTPLLCAVRAGFAPTVKLLLGKGAIVDVINFDKETQISIAKKLKDPTILKMLQKALKKQEKDGLSGFISMNR